MTKTELNMVFNGICDILEIISRDFLEFAIFSFSHEIMVPEWGPGKIFWWADFRFSQKTFFCFRLPLSFQCRKSDEKLEFLIHFSYSETQIPFHQGFKFCSEIHNFQSSNFSIYRRPKFQTKWNARKQNGIWSQRLSSFLIRVWLCMQSTKTL